MQVKLWHKYIDLELSASSGGDLEAVKLLFGRCLMNYPSVDLHQQYLQ